MRYVSSNSHKLMVSYVRVDDPYGLPLSLGYALRDAKVPFELHVLLKGGHGYGLRPGNPAAETWPNLAKKWLKTVVKW